MHSRLPFAGGGAAFAAAAASAFLRVACTVFKTLSSGKKRKRKEKATSFGVNLMRSQVSYRAAHDAERYITRGMAEVWTIAFVDATCSMLMICCTIELEQVLS